MCTFVSECVSACACVCLCVLAPRCAPEFQRSIIQFHLFRVRVRFLIVSKLQISLLDLIDFLIFMCIEVTLDAMNTCEPMAME